MIPVLAGGDEIAEMIERIMAGEDREISQKQEIKEFPGSFSRWIRENEDRINEAKTKDTLPYFIKDNQNAIKKILHPSKSK